MKVLKFVEFDRYDELALEIIENMANPLLNENLDNDVVKKILTKFSKDLGFNIGMVFTFGTGITLMVPIIQRLIDNSNLSIEVTKENIILLCITVLSVTYLEETKNKTGEDLNAKGEESKVKRKDVQTMLAELKLRGIGNGIVKSLANVFVSIGDFFKVILRATPYVINSLFDMFSYTALMIPAMNAISSFIGKYDITIDNIVANLLSIGTAAGALVAKQGVSWLINKLKVSLNIKNIDIPKSDDRVISPYDMIDIGVSTSKDSNLIKEQ